MPPLRRSSGVSGRSRDIVLQVEHKLKLGVEIPKHVLEATRSSLRVLKIRNPIGSFGKYDNETKRACALLEYDVRDYNRSNNDSNNIEITTERLAKAAFMKLKDFREFHEKIGNFRDNLHTNATNTSKVNKKRPVSVGTNPRVDADTGNDSNKGGVLFRNSSIPSLAIQMGAFVPNSSDAAVRAQNLLKDAVDLLKNSSKKGGMHGLRDIQRNQSSYEAACFYVVATKERSKQGWNAPAMRGRRCKSSKDYVDDREDNQQLDLSTFLDVTKEIPSQFQTVLSYVKELESEIESKECANRNKRFEVLKSQSSSRPSSSSQGKSSSKTGKSIASKKRSRRDGSGTAESIATKFRKNNDGSAGNQNGDCMGGVDVDVDVDIDAATFTQNNNDENNEYCFGGRNPHRYSERKSRPNPAFKEWKAKILDEACEAVRQKITADKEGNNEGDDDDDDDSQEKDNSFETEDAIALASRDILIRLGLL